MTANDVALWKTINELRDDLNRIKGRTLSADLSSVFNVKAYGATGGGAVDDTAAFTAALAALRAAGGGALYVPVGTYKITSKLTVDLTDPITGNVQSALIYGDGAHSVINYTAVDGTDCLYVSGVVGGIPTLHIHDLAINGPGAGSGNGLVLRRCIMPAQLDSLTIQGFGGGYGIKLISCWTTDIRDVFIYDGLGGYAFENDAVPGSYGSTVNISMYNCNVQGTTSYGIYGNQAPLHLEIINCIIEGIASHGIYLDHTQMVEIVNCYFEGNTGYHIYLAHCTGTLIRLCSGGGALNVFADSNSTGIISEMNAWDHSVVMDAFAVRNFMSTITSGTGQWRNYETLNNSTYVADGDTSPSVDPGAGYTSTFYITGNTAPTTINNFDDGYVGQFITVVVTDNNTTFDFTGSGLAGNSGVDYVAHNGDRIRAQKDPWVWNCEIIKGS